MAVYLRTRDETLRFFEIIDRVQSYHPEVDVAFLEKAYVFAAKVHGGRARLNGEPYLSHPLAVAGILVHMRLGEESISAGLLHDVLEEGHATPEELEQVMGTNVMRIVQSVTKLTQLDFSHRREAEAEYRRKMILAMSEDIRVVLVKLADRLQDMRSFEHHCSEAQRALAQETLDIYAPLAARVGIEWMKVELEDLAFKCLQPEEYGEIFDELERTAEDRSRYVDEVMGILTANLEEHDIQGRVTGRSKHLYSVYLKMRRQNLDLQRIHDLIAFRIIVDSVKTCYEALGMVHGLWEPVPGRFKDYIVRAKSNMYQSLHTTVIGPYGERMEVQIRTDEMDRVANEGIAAHWLYKQRGRGGAGREADAEEVQKFSWVRELLEWNKEWRHPRTFFETVKGHFYQDEVYVFTPRGEVKAFPRGATPVDFAYEVHSEVGHRCVGARVNGKMVPLRTELQNGDTVEVLTAPNHHPSKDWLKFVKTSKATQRIRQWFKAEERERSIALGREICEREFRKKSLNFNNFINSPELLEVARGFSLRSVDDLLASLGYHKISPFQVIGKLTAVPAEEAAERDELVVDKKKPAARDGGIKVRGVDDVLIRMARCCNPLPGDPIVGYITRGRGITVHRQQCRNLGRGDEERKIDVQWDSGEDQVYPVDIRVVYSGVRGMLATLNGLLGQLDVRVVDLKVDSQGKDTNACLLRLEVRDTKHLQRVLTALKTEKGVYRVQRSMD